MVRVLLLIAVVALGASDAAAHGRDPIALHIEFRHDHPQDVLAGTTIGLLTSHDGGATWRWTCEEAVHYQDPFDPDYAYAADGTIFAQTFTGLGIDRQTCGFSPTNLGKLVISSVTTTGTGVVYAASSDATDHSIYKSIDNGVSFAPVSAPGQLGDWWRSLEVAKSDSERVYLTGYRFIGTTKQFLFFVSRDGGATFDPIDTASFATTDSSMIDVVHIGANPDLVYARVTFSREPDNGDVIYRSTDAGATWGKLFTNGDPYGVSFLARSTGELVVATRLSGAWHSFDDGATWQPLPNPPHISSLVETPSGDVWAGTQNYLGIQPGGRPPIPSDGYAIMKSSDLVTWTPVMRMQDLAGVACREGTDVFVQCAGTDRGLGTAWCCLVSTLGITASEIDCSGPRSCGAVAGDITVPPPDGCCQSGSQPSLLVVLLLCGYAYRPRRAACLRARGHRSR
ncbi:MAG TPA: sialidase family protein [Kofleriaceae bacterium]|nr:sialidase family protein [Kofleriaceae bacterium]